MKTTKTLVALLLSAVLIFGVFPALNLSQNAAAAVLHSKSEALNWMKAQVGKHIDVDGFPADQPYQCVDLIATYYDYLNGNHNGISGNAKDYATNYVPDGFTRIQGATPEPGDIVICTSSTYGHVWLQGADGIRYHQNVTWSGELRNYVAEYTYDWEEIWGVIRPSFPEDAHVHNYTEYVYYWKAHPHYNCYKCSCGEIKENRDEVAYNEVTVPGYKPTCTEPGLSDGATCSICGITVKEQEEIPATGHDYSFLLSNADPENMTLAVKYTCIRGDDQTENEAIPDAAVTVGDKTYFRYDSDLLPWESAKDAADMLSATLAMPKTDDEFAAVKKLASEGTVWSYILGATDEDEEGVWVWMDGTPMNRTEWNEGEPNNSTDYGPDVGENYLCISRDSGRLNDFYGKSRRGWIVEKTIKESDVPEDEFILSAETRESDGKLILTLNADHNPGFALLRVNVSDDLGNLGEPGVAKGLISADLTYGSNLLFTSSENCYDEGEFATLVYELPEPGSEYSLTVSVKACVDIDEKRVPLSRDIFTVSGTTAEMKPALYFGEPSISDDGVSVIVSIANNPGFMNLRAALEYDKDALELAEVANGKVCPSLTIGKNLVWTSASDAGNNGELASLRFKVLDPAGDLTVKLTVRAAYNSAEEAVEFENNEISVVLPVQHSEHIWDDGVVTLEPTCGKDGEILYTCEICGETNPETIPATGEHTPGEPVETVVKEPEVGVAGEKKITVTCAVCGQVISEETDEIPALEPEESTGKDPETDPTVPVETLPDGVYDRGDYILVEPGLTVMRVVKDALAETGVLKADGSAAEPDEAIATGMKLVYPDGSEKPLLVMGDADGDGAVGAADARLALRASVALEEFNEFQNIVANVDFDESVTPADARLILRAAVNLEDPGSWYRAA